jgi:hypothetical protein
MTKTKNFIVSPSDSANSSAEQKITSQTHYIFTATKLGMAIMKSNLSPEEGLMVYLDLQNAQ